jgi:tRNA-specific 2-thiouridylase
MRIAVAMSGGVDSSLTAVLLKNEGHDIVGITAKVLLCADMDGAEPRYDVCCSPENIADARDLAREHGFPHTVLDVEEDFSREIIDPFCAEYLAGRTPSPCLHCNARIKFKSLLERARELGCEKLATGHYARLGISGSRYFVAAGADPDKDQSYFLGMLPQEILASTLLPLGGYRKEEIRKMAADLGLKVAHKPESQEICFVLDDDYAGYIERRTGRVPPHGNIVDMEGRVLGRHRGIHHYTIGQRRGLGIAHPVPLYVVEIRAGSSEIVVTEKARLAKKGLFAVDIHYMKSTCLEGPALVKTRSVQARAAATLHEGDGGVYVELAEPMEGISPGQAAVFYDGDGAVMGAAWIKRSL